VKQECRSPKVWAGACGLVRVTWTGKSKRRNTWQRDLAPQEARGRPARPAGGLRSGAEPSGRLALPRL